MAAAAAGSQTKTASRTVTDTIVGEHTHTIVGYSLIKGIGDGEPIASERFTVGGHEWVLLFYPDGKRSSSSEGHIGGGGGNGGGGEHAAQIVPVGAGAGIVVNLPPPLPALPMQAQPAADAQGDGPAVAQPAAAAAQAAVQAAHQAALQAAAPPAAPVGVPQQLQMVVHHHHPAMQPQQMAQRQQRRDTTNEYAALFVALIGEGTNPQGIVNTSEGKVVRAFHRFTLVDQTEQGRDLTKGRTRDAGAVKISCARQDPNARNCHGYRKFVKRSILEDPSRGFLMNDTIIIKYTIELVVSSGGALSRAGGSTKSELIKVPPSCLGSDLGKLLASGNGADYTITVEDEEFKVHKIILEARSRVFRVSLNSEMREGQEGQMVIGDIKAPVFKALLHFVYTDALPEEHDGNNLEVPMAQHLLVAADKYELVRLRRICERRLCETVDVETVGTTLTLAEQNHAEELKKVCLDFVSRNLAAVMCTEGYQHMTQSCPRLQAEILQTIATSGSAHQHERGGAGHGGNGGAAGGTGGNGHTAHRGHGTVRMREHTVGPEDASGVEVRRVRPRRE